jgi:ATP-binding cassette subfamily F protein uup
MTANSPLVRLEDVSLGYGAQPLLDAVCLEIQEGERVCLVGRNGTGKSTLLRVVSGELVPDDGGVWRREGARIAALQQEVPADEARPVFAVVADGLGGLGESIAEYHRRSAVLACRDDPDALQRLSDLQHEIEAVDGWRLEQRVATVLTQFGLPAEQPVSSLSGGLKRRVMLARALVNTPDLLLLDEPTNHLDIDAITWLEEFLAGYAGALLFVTHDRAFLRRLATRIIELDRGVLTSWPGDYANYLRRREERMAEENAHNALFDKRLAREELWIRQGIRARRTRNEGRVRVLAAMREEHSRRRMRPGKVSMSLDRGTLSGRLVAEAEGVWFGYRAAPLIRDFSTRILRGDRIGIIGPNGAGKSTLIRLLLGDLGPDRGTIRCGTGLQVAYFDQQRAQLDPECTVVDSLGLGSDTVTVNGRPRHVIGYLGDFLFPPQRAQSPVSSLSGGERNRLLLARLFTRPANLLVLDEPTNDLDVETLELLEELLLQYDGTLLLVSHDRAFLDNVVTSTLVFEGEGRISEYTGGYQDWLRQRLPVAAARETPVRRGREPPAPESARRSRPRKLSYREQRELQQLPERIETLEAEQAELQSRINERGFYGAEREKVAGTLARLESVTGELDHCYERWLELDRIGS